MSRPILPKLLPPAAKNLFVKRFLDFQKLFTKIVSMGKSLKQNPIETHKQNTGAY